MSFIPSFSVVDSPGSTPPRTTALVLHGVLGSGQNFRGIARKLCERRPDYRFVLVDLRHHGQSSGAPPPDTLAECARDLGRLLTHLQREQADTPPASVVIGHSFGGKVALEFSRQCPELRQVWVLDSDPGTQPAKGTSGEIARVIAAVRAVPVPLSRRSEVIPTLTGKGLSQGLANWMTTNLKREGEGYTWVFDLDRIEALLADYYAEDLWEYLETLTPPPDVHLVVAEQSERFTKEMRARAQHLEEQGHLRYHLIEKAGHWLHVDNPEAVLELLVNELVRD